MKRKPTGVLAALSPKALIAAMGWGRDTPLSAVESASTLFRFFRSRHVGDLRVIFSAALLVAEVSVIFFVYKTAAHLFGPDNDGTALGDLLNNYVIPMLAFCCVIIGWAYRSASARLGVVDLFACEISTVCRVGTVFDIGTQYIELYHADGCIDEGSPPTTGLRNQPSGAFVSQEHYFPVFDGNSRDLQLLEARVVSNIVEFYTYMKALRDTLRKVATLESGTDPCIPPDAGAVDRESPRQRSICNAIYLTFLAYESGRKAIKDLVEFDPTRAENTMTILVTELKCYGFLLRSFKPRDLRRERLELRRADYLDHIPCLQDEVMRHTDSGRDWLPALRTAPELSRRYEEVLAIPSC